jgi:hypothetical protein
MSVFIDQEPVELHSGSIDIDSILEIVEPVKLHIDLGPENTGLITTIGNFDWHGLVRVHRKRIRGDL